MHGPHPSGGPTASLGIRRGYDRRTSLGGSPYGIMLTCVLPTSSYQVAASNQAIGEART